MKKHQEEKSEMFLMSYDELANGYRGKRKNKIIDPLTIKALTYTFLVKGGDRHGIKSN